MPACGAGVSAAGAACAAASGAGSWLRLGLGVMLGGRLRRARAAAAGSGAGGGAATTARGGGRGGRGHGPAHGGHRAVVRLGGPAAAAAVAAEAEPGLDQVQHRVQRGVAQRHLLGGRHALDGQRRPLESRLVANLAAEPARSMEAGGLAVIVEGDADQVQAAGGDVAVDGDLAAAGVDGGAVVGGLAGADVQQGVAVGARDVGALLDRDAVGPLFTRTSWQTWPSTRT
ncbi:hypothetical protein ACU4GA_29660 [Methylobacterium oryzae CBMB20]